MSYSARVIRKLQGREEIFSQFSSDEDDDQQGDVEAFSNKFAMVNYKLYIIIYSILSFCVAYLLLKN